MAHQSSCEETGSSTRSAAYRGAGASAEPCALSSSPPASSESPPPAGEAPVATVGRLVAVVVGRQLGLGLFARRVLVQKVGDGPLQPDRGERRVEVPRLRGVGGSNFDVGEQAGRREAREQVGGDELDRPDGERQERHQDGAGGRTVQDGQDEQPALDE
eukprot:scaffold2706_cov109-Isochrysis_galbana.AAC.17